MNTDATHWATCPKQLPRRIPHADAMHGALTLTFSTDPAVLARVVTALREWKPAHDN